MHNMHDAHKKHGYMWTESGWMERLLSRQGRENLDIGNQVINQNNTAQKRKLKKLQEIRPWKKRIASSR